MLLRGLTALVLFQLLGTLLNVLWLSFLPGPIIGLVLLFVFLLWRGEVDEPLAVASTSLLRYLPLLLVPAAAGVMLYGPVLKANFWALAAALLLSLVLALLFTGWLMQRLIERQQRREAP